MPAAQRVKYKCNAPFHVSLLFLGVERTICPEGKKVDGRPKYIQAAVFFEQRFDCALLAVHCSV